MNNNINIFNPIFVWTNLNLPENIEEKKFFLSNKAGIYRIKNMVNDSMYIGSSID
jgi:group I intron endonuclease